MEIKFIIKHVDSSQYLGEEHLTSIEAVYKTIVEFIKWYNTIKQ